MFVDSTVDYGQGGYSWPLQLLVGFQFPQLLFFWSSCGVEAAES